MKHLDLLKSKIRTDISLERWLARVRFREQRIVFTNGCFDILHRGHIQYLAEAAEMGDQLVVGLNTDESVRRIKGPERPFMDQESRAFILAALDFVSVVTFFNEDTPLELIHRIQPDVLVKGGDYQPEQIVGYDIVKAKGGQVVTCRFVRGSSTTRILDRIKASVK